MMILTSLVRGEEREEMSRKVLYLARSFWLVKNLSFIVPVNILLLCHEINLTLFKSVYWNDNPLGMLGEQKNICAFSHKTSFINVRYWSCYWISCLLSHMILDEVKHWKFKTLGRLRSSVVIWSSYWTLLTRKKPTDSFPMGCCLSFLYFWTFSRFKSIPITLN